MKQFWTSVADTSLLDFAACCEAEDASFEAILSDAQGNAVHNKSKIKLTMMVYTQNGSCIALTEAFVHWPMLSNR